MCNAHLRLCAQYTRMIMPTVCTPYTHAERASLFFPEKSGESAEKSTWQNMVYCILFLTCFFHYHLVPSFLPPPAITVLLSMAVSPLSLLLDLSIP